MHISNKQTNKQRSWVSVAIRRTKWAQTRLVRCPCNFDGRSTRSIAGDMPPVGRAEYGTLPRAVASETTKPAKGRPRVAVYLRNLKYTNGNPGLHTFPEQYGPLSSLPSARDRPRVLPI